VTRGKWGLVNKVEQRQGYYRVTKDKLRPNLSSHSDIPMEIFLRLGSTTGRLKGVKLHVPTEAVRDEISIDRLLSGMGEAYRGIWSGIRSRRGNKTPGEIGNCRGNLHFNLP
jgi:hypothetical protein